MEDGYKRDFIYMRDRHSTVVEKVSLTDHHDPSLRTDPVSSELIRRMVAGWVEAPPPPPVVAEADTEEQADVR